MGKPRLWDFSKTGFRFGHVSEINWFYFGKPRSWFHFLFLKWIMGYANSEKRSFCSRGWCRKGRFWDHSVMKWLSNLPNTCWKSTFLMFSKTRSGETSREKFRMVRALLPDTPKPHQFQLKLQFSSFYRIFSFSSFYRIFYPSTPWEPKGPMGGDPMGGDPWGAHSKVCCDAVTFEK